MDCPICGTPNATCGHQPLRFPPIPALTTNIVVASTTRGTNDMASSDKDKKVHLPLRQPRRGVAGYRGGPDVVIHDANDKDVTKQASHPRKK